MSQLPDVSQRSGFKKGVGLIDLVMLGAGTAIGSSVFTVLGPAAEVGGAGLLPALVVAAVPMVVFGVVYAYMASAVPRTAAAFEWQRAYTTPGIAFGIVWMRVLSSGVVMVLLGQTLVQYLSLVVDLPGRVVVLGLFAAVFVVNYIGVAVAARLQTVLMLGLLVVFAVFVATGVHAVDPAVFVEAFATDAGPILAAVPLMISLFLGIETTTEVGEEVKDPARTVPLGLVLAMALTAVVYLAICATSLGLLGPVALASSEAPLVAAAQVVLGGWAQPLIVTAAVLALVKSMNAVFLVYARFLYAMGNAGQLPAPLGRLHPRWGTPHVATAVAFVLCCAGLLLPSSLLFLLLAVSVPTMAKYFGSCLAAFRVVTRFPDVAALARIRFRRTTVVVLSVLGMVAAVVVAALGLSTDVRPYLLLAGWLVIGLAYYAWTHRGARS